MQFHWWRWQQVIHRCLESLLMINQQLHCALVEVHDGVNCAPFSALPFYKGYQQTVFGSLEDLSEHLEHRLKIHCFLQKFAQHRKWVIHTLLLRHSDVRFRLHSTKERAWSAAGYGFQIYLWNLALLFLLLFSFLFLIGSDSYIVTLVDLLLIFWSKNSIIQFL